MRITVNTYSIFALFLTTFATRYNKDAFLPVSQMIVNGESLMMDCVTYQFSTEYIYHYGDDVEEPVRGKFHQELTELRSLDGNRLFAVYEDPYPELEATIARYFYLYSPNLEVYLETDFDLSIQNGIQFSGDFSDSDNQITFDMDLSKMFE